MNKIFFATQNDVDFCVIIVHCFVFSYSTERRDGGIDKDYFPFWRADAKTGLAVSVLVNASIIKSFLLLEWSILVADHNIELFSHLLKWMGQG